MLPNHPLFLHAAAHFFVFGSVMVLSAAIAGMGLTHLPWFAFVIISVCVVLQVLLIAAISMGFVTHYKVGVPLFIGGLALVTLLMVLPSIDVQTRGSIDSIRGDRPVDVSAPFDETQSARAKRLRLGGREIPSSFVPPGR